MGSDEIISFWHPDRHTDKAKPIHPRYAGCNNFLLCKILQHAFLSACPDSVWKWLGVERSPLNGQKVPDGHQGPDGHAGMGPTSWGECKMWCSDEFFLAPGETHTQTRQNLYILATQAVITSYCAKSYSILMLSCKHPVSSIQSSLHGEHTEISFNQKPTKWLVQSVTATKKL